MNEISIGEYVKDRLGKIFKVKKIEFDSEMKENYYWLDVFGIFGTWEHEIKKHSFNKIDLIEIGDICVLEDEFCEFNYYYMYDKNFIRAIKEDIKKGRKLISILTHEQFKANEYRFEEEE